MRVLPLAIVVVAVVLAARVETAHGCSCGIVDPRSMLAEADGAFIGTLLERRDGPAAHLTLVFRVLERVKGALGRTVEVRTEGSAMCGLEADIGDQVGLFLDLRENGWHGSLCWQVEPAAMKQAGEPLPAPRGRGPPAFVISGTFGSARLMTLDARLRTLAYGRGSGSAVAISPCPGKRSIAVAFVDTTSGKFRLELRGIPRLDPKRTQPLRVPLGTGPIALHCDSSDGERVYLFVAAPVTDRDAVVYRVLPRRLTPVWHGPAWHATFVDGYVWINRLARSRVELVRVHLATRRARVIAQLPRGSGPVTVDASGTRLTAPFTSVGPGASGIAVVSLAGTATVRIRRINGVYQGSSTCWIGEDAIALLTHDLVRVLDPMLRRVRAIRGWHMRAAACDGKRAVGLGFDGQLRELPLPQGPTRLVRRLPSPAVSGIVTM